MTERAPSLADKAYEEIRAMILDLRLLPGQAILIADLATQLGMSRTPVREAVARLSTSREGLVTTVPRKGVVVTIPTVEGMREIYEIIEALEGQAGRLAIACIDAEALAALEECVAAQEAALARGDLGAWTQADRQFHRLLIAASGNRHMTDLVRIYDGQLHRIRVATIHLRRTPCASTEEHRSILDAIRARDAAMAMAIHAAHRARALDEMLRAVADYSSMVHAHGGVPEYAVYAATKGAIVSLTKQLAIEMIPHRIRVNALVPGHVEVPRHLANPNY